ncbi:MAG: serpin family protein, partial [Polyangia bacterium]|nr:serpin family protein [Polyangia bacterium]
EIANSVWYRQGFSVDQGFLDRNETYFDAEVSALDFSAPGAAEIINDWVDANTNGRITEIVDDPISEALVMFLINAVYFKGTWTLQFDPEDTQDEPFTTSGGAQVTVPMMRLHGDLLAFETSEVQAVDLAYGDGLYRMAVVLPRPGVTLESVVSGLDVTTWSTWISLLTEQEAELSLPRFELTYEASLAQVLSDLGMGAAFTPGGADFSGISPQADLYISDVKHKTFLKVDEEGTEAAAVTSVEVGTTSVPQIFTMRVDRPFLVVIHDTHTQSMLFMGRVGNPS